ncbi:MAG: exodeoxyribonuclease VII large subunit [Pseudomonadota bacterium]
MSDSVIDDAPEGVNTPEYSVSEISGALKQAIEGRFAHVRVRGEVGRVSRPRSGHIYLDLKDERAVLSGVVWKGVSERLEIAPQEGDEVIATGRLTTFAGQSKYQIVIERLAYAGAGALLAKLERLRKALAEEGLFDESRKRPLPFLPDTIGVVTSPSGAVIRDILHRLTERFPVRVLLWPVAVQGVACAPEVAAAVRGFDALPRGGPVPRPDVVIVARGGGSVEDLWGFNEEQVVRAVAASSIPVISAVGHETDTTLIDFAADRRAPTPTAAAEIAVPVRTDLMAGLADLDGRRLRALTRRLELSRRRVADLSRALPRAEDLVARRQQRLDAVAARLPRPDALTRERRQRLDRASRDLPRALTRLVDLNRRAVAAAAGRLPRPARLLDGPRTRLAGWARALRPRLVSAPLAQATARLGERGQRLDAAGGRSLKNAQERVAALARLLESLGYRQTLARGYAVVRTEDGAVVTKAKAVRAGHALDIEFADGHASTIAARKPKRSTRKPDPETAQGSLFDDGKA